MLFGRHDCAEVFFWAESVHHGSESAHGKQERHDDGEDDDEPKNLEHDDLCKEQPESAADSCDTTTQDTYSHFSI